VFEVTVPALRRDRLAAALGDAQYRALDELAERARADLSGHTLWNLSSTATGGGVAEMLHGLVGYALAAGIDTRWLVVEGDAPFFALTKRIHNLLHGSPGDGGPLGAADRATYEGLLAREAAGLRASLEPGDVVVLHDPQTAGLTDVVRACGATPIWRCHVGTDTTDGRTEQAWSFLRPYLGSAAATVFSRAAYVPAWLGDGGGRTAIIQPAVDPVSTKNLELDPGRVLGVLTAAGLLDGRPAAAAGVAHPATLVRDGGPFPRDVPLVVQVSRWDHLKDMAGVLDAFCRGVVDGAPGSEAHLLLAGPSVAGVTDDPEGLRVLEEVTAAWRALPDRARRRVGLASLDMTDVDENALVVNALQRHATVVTQKSLREGFGLTVAEAMWKSRPVVASAVGGIRDQIDDGVSGRLVGPDDRRAFAAAVVDLVADPGSARRLGAAAHERVRERFLPDRQLGQWLDLVRQVRSGAGPADRGRVLTDRAVPVSEVGR
jgi:trehalose synthase